MKPTRKEQAFIIESNSDELPKKVKDLITVIGTGRRWEAGRYYHWPFNNPIDEINTYALNNGAKLKHYVLIHW